MAREPRPTAGQRQLAQYLATDDIALLVLLRAEQREADRRGMLSGHRLWVRIDDYGNAISGGCLSGSIQSRLAAYALARLERIEHVLKARGFSRDVLDDWRFNELSIDDERAGLQDDIGDTSFEFSHTEAA